MPSIKTLSISLVFFLTAHPSLAIEKNTTANADIKTFSVNKKTSTVKTWLPKGWEPLIDVYNTPLALLSKKGAQDKRTVIQIVPYGIKDSEDNLLKFKKDPEEFYAQKEDWLESMDGETISYEPFEEIIKDGTITYSIGIKYKNDLGRFLDKTYYLSSKSKGIFYVKAVIPLDFEEQHTSEVNRVISSIANQN